MRLTTIEVTRIKEIITSYDPEARIYLFGSRVRDELKGGDIDLLICSQKINSTEKRKIKLKLYDTLGEQKIDVVLEKDITPAFIKVIKEGAVQL
jgi:predicted nucleotidyltransferase